MRLGYVLAEERGLLDPLLAAVAGRLEAAGLRLGGAVQINSDRPGQRCDMALRLLDGQGRTRPGNAVPISQRLGGHARGCRLDPSGLEDVVAQVAAQLTQDPPMLLIVNKFGKAEIGGRGFRPVIAQALEAGVPVLVGVSRSSLDAFVTFSGGLAERLTATEDAVLDWCRYPEMPRFR